MLQPAQDSASAHSWPGDFAAGGLQFQSLLDKLPGAAYTCDADGLITYYNVQAEKLWGRAPTLNDPVDRFCGSFKLFSPDGFLITHDQCWVALALRMNQPFIGHEIVIERPDGRLLTALAHANPFHDDHGACIGAVNVLVDITARKEAESEIQRLNESLEQQIAERVATLRIMQELTTVANEARTVEQAMRAALTRVCGYTKWPLGHVFCWDERHERMVSSGVWHARDELELAPELLAEFQDLSRR